MARPEKCRRICSRPAVREFVPLGVEPRGEVVMGYDEYEALRLIDVEGYTHLACADKMGVSRATVSRIYDNARKKITQAMVEAKKLRIDGGDVYVCTAQRPECANVPRCCHRNNIEKGTLL